MRLSSLLACTALVASMAALASSPAAAAPIFTINPNVLGCATCSNSVAASDMTLNSDSLIIQTGATTQTETGWAQATTYTNNGSTINHTVSGLDTTGGGANTYGLYFTFTATVNGITGFGAGQTGTVTDFNYVLKADIGNNDIFTAGATGAVPVAPSVTDTGSNDLVLAVGSSTSGSAGFQTATGAPIFSTVNSFIICNGVSGQGLLGGVVTAAAACGTFNATTYFTSPNPFYSVDFVSTTSGSTQNLTVDAAHGNATLNGIVADLNFSVPEPLTLSVFGAGLAGAAALRRRKAKKA